MDQLSRISPSTVLAPCFELGVWLACCQTVKALPETSTESERKACCHAVPSTSRSI